MGYKRAGQWTARSLGCDEGLLTARHDSQEDSQIAGHLQTTADVHGIYELGLELRWTLMDGEDANPAVCKTVCGRPQPSL